MVLTLLRLEQYRQNIVGVWKQSTHLASRANAKTPAASGAAAEVPE